MFGYYPEATSCSPIALILWILLGLPLLYFFECFPLPSVTLRDSVTTPRVFSFLDWMIAFSRRETCYGGIFAGSWSKQVASILSRSRSPTSMSSEAPSLDPGFAWGSSGWIKEQPSSEAAIIPGETEGTWFLASPDISLSSSPCWLLGFLTCESVVWALAFFYDWSFWRVTNRFWVCTLLWTLGPEFFLACSFCFGFW